MNRPHLVKDATTGLVSFLVLGLVIWLCLALYSQAFRSYDVITVEADRTGLLMDPGADVKLHGVVVGRVGEVTADQDGATLTLEVDKGRLAEIPADATVRIVPPTVFGAKYVELRTATAPGGPALEPGTVISGARVTVEINQTFDAARQALDNIDAAKLNTTLSSTAEVLEGRGAELGRLIRASDELTGELVEQVPAIGASASAADRTARAYLPAADPFVATLSGAGEVVENLHANESALAAALQGVSSLSLSLAGFVRVNEAGLADTTGVLLPISAVLARYAPEYNCTLRGVAYNAKLVKAVAGGTEAGGSSRNAHVTLVISRSKPAYENPRDLPKVAASSGPNCQRLPQVNGFVPFQKFDTGADPHPSNDDSSSIGDVPLDLLLFGRSLSGEAGGSR